MKHVPTFLFVLLVALAVFGPLGCDVPTNTGNPYGLSDSEIEEGLASFRDQVREDIKEHPVIVEHIGTISAIELDMDASEKLPGENDFVFNLTGSNGQGVLTATCITIDEDTEDVTAGSLKISTGETISLFE